MGAHSGDLAARLADYGFDVTQLELSEFHRGGGSVKSMALRLSDLEIAEAL
jgi:N-dimethylarginine dimethylaminohydrolase